MKQAVMALAAGWERTPPSRRQMEAGADRLEDLRKSGAPPLWERPPGFLTFTLDDMLGQGITLINKLGAACGMTVRFLGLTQTREKVIEAVLETKPQLLGCTVLQLDTGEDIRFIRDRVPPHIPITAGGPLFKADPSLAREWGIDYPCSTAADFLKILPEIQGRVKTRVLPGFIRLIRPDDHLSPQSPVSKAMRSHPIPGGQSDGIQQLLDVWSQTC